MASIEGCSLALSFMEDARSVVHPAAIVEAYSTLLFRVANSVLRSRTEAEDVVQDVFIRLLEHRVSLSTVRDMRVWLIRIAWNLALDRKRRKRPEQLDETFARSLASQPCRRKRQWRRHSAFGPSCVRSRDCPRQNAMSFCSPPSRSWAQPRSRRPET